MPCFFILTVDSSSQLDLFTMCYEKNNSVLFYSFNPCHCHVNLTI